MRQRLQLGILDGMAQLFRGGMRRTEVLDPSLFQDTLLIPTISPCGTLSKGMAKTLESLESPAVFGHT